MSEDNITIIGKDQTEIDVSQYGGETVQVGDKNKQVEKILQAIKNDDPSELFEKGSIFNLLTGEISYTKIPHFGKNWSWFSYDCFPIYSKEGNYLGHQTGDKLMKLQEN